MSDPVRRGLLGVAAAAAAGLAGVMLAPGIRLVEVAQAAEPAGRTGANPKVRWGMLIDTTKCASGCTDCVDACNAENGLGEPQRSTDARWIRKVEIKEIRTGRASSVPVMCQHCAEPPCVDVCPTGASFKRADGIVLVDRVPRGKGCVESCTLCVHRLDKGEHPSEATTACAEACTQAGHGAILFGDLNDPASEISRRVREIRSTQLRADLRLDPGVRYVGL